MPTRRVHQLQVGGASLNAIVEGASSGPWLTCLHALATDHRLWDDQVSALGGRFRLLRLDMRGHGGSTVGAAAGAMSGLVEDVRAAWDALEIERSSVLGLSIGGMIAIGLALNHPERVERMVAAACRTDAPAGFRAMWDERDHLLRSGGMPAVAEATLPTWLTEQTRSENPALVERVRDMILGASEPGYLAATQALRSLDYKPRLDEISCPTLLVVGARDGVMPAAMADIAAALPHAGLIEIPEAAHLVNLERPDPFMAAVLPFLNAV